MLLRIGSVVTALVLGLAVLAPSAGAAPAPVERTAKVKAPQAGKYQGTTFDDGRANKTEYVRFQVTKGGKKMKGFTTRIGMYCYVGAPVYYQIIPTVIKAPAMKIKKGKIKRGWVSTYRADGMPYTLTGRLVVNFKRGRPTTGRVAVDFASCGTTTGDPAGYIPFKVRPKK